MDEEAPSNQPQSDNSGMLTSYIRAAMRQARYEIVEDDGSFYGDIPAIPGVWANAKTLEACREELESVLEGWVLLSIADHSPIPDIDGNRLEIREVASMPAIGPIKRKDLIACLRSLGFEPPVSLALEIEVPFAA